MPPNPTSSLRNEEARTWSSLAFLALSGAEGIIALLVMGQVRSMEGNAVFAGYSLPRVVLGGLFAALAILLLAATIKTLLDRDSLRTWLRVANAWLSASPSRLVRIVLYLMCVTGLGAYVLSLFHFSLVTSQLYVLQIAASRIAPGLLWLVLIHAQLLALVAYHYPALLGKATLEDESTPRSAVLAMLLTGTFAQWVTLLLRAEWLSRIPGWFYEWRPVEFFPSIAVVAPVVVVAVLVVDRIQKPPKHHKLNMTVLLLLFGLLQVVFGVSRGGGLEALRLKYADSPKSDETRAACAAGSVATVFRNYEAEYGENFWLGTKPPGLLAVLVAFRDLIRVLLPLQVGESCFRTLTTVYVFVFPLLASAVLLPMHWLEDLWAPTAKDGFPGVMLIATPSAVLMPIVLDQSLFPLLFVISILAVTSAVLRQSISLGILAGVSVCVATLVSFSLLPLLGYVVVFPLLQYLFGDAARRSWRQTATFLAVCLGLLATVLLVKEVLGYDPLGRYQAAMASHRQIKSFEEGASRLVEYAVLNNAEVVHWFGVPVVLLFLVQAGRSVRALLRRGHSEKDVFVVAVLLTYIGLNVFGQTRGEVGRLWIFFLPLICIVAAEGGRGACLGSPRMITTVYALALTGTSITYFLLGGGTI